MPEHRGISQNRYLDIIKRVFRRNFEERATEVGFSRAELVEAARDPGLDVPKNLGDIVYSIRYRIELPVKIDELAPTGITWALFAAGTALFACIARRPVGSGSGRLPGGSFTSATVFQLKDAGSALEIIRPCANVRFLVYPTLPVVFHGRRA